MKFPIALFFAILAVRGAAFAATAEAEQRLHRVLDEVIAVAESSPNNAVLLQKIRPIATKNMSFSAMTRRAIGPGWKQFTPAQRTKAIELFSELIIRRYANRYTIGEHPNVVYRSATSPAPGMVEVPTLLDYKGSKYQVLYRLEQAEDWRITDVVVEGVSFIASYRTQFNAPFQSGGPEAVLNALNSTVQDPK